MTIKSMMKNSKSTEEEINATVDEILDEDLDDDFNVTESATCSRDCDQSVNAPKETPRRCKCGVENSSRFSLRVMEAMRSLQREVDQPLTSTAEDIVDYIRANYRSDGDLYAQVRTALRQVCSQGFAMELLDNEFHLIGPVATSRKKYGCSPGCEGRLSPATYDTLRERISANDDENGARRGGRSPKKNGPPFRGIRSPREESLRRTVNRPDDITEKAIFSSTRRELNNARQRGDVAGVRGTERRDGYRSPIAGPSRVVSRVPSPVPTKRVRVTDENDEEITAEGDCTCDADVEVTRLERSRRRPGDRTPRLIVKNHRNGRSREEGAEETDAEEDAEEDVEEGAEEDAEEEEDDDDVEDSAYGELRRHVSRRRTTARERELKRWIRRCREECERRMRR